MIVIKIIILYFIQIRHTDDFPSTDTRLVLLKNGFAGRKPNGRANSKRYAKCIV